MKHHNDGSTVFEAEREYGAKAQAKLAGAERLLRLWGSLITEFPATKITTEQLELLLTIRSSIWDQAMSDHEEAVALLSEVGA